MSKARLHRVSVIATLDEFVTIKPFLCQLSKFHASCEFVYLKASLNQTLLKVIINGGASFRWSFGPLSVWDSIESMTILTTHPSLHVSNNVVLILQSFLFMSHSSASTSLVILFVLVRLTLLGWFCWWFWNCH